MGPGFLDLTTAISDRELQVDITILGRPISFLLDTEAPFVILPEFWGPTSPRSFIVRVGGQLTNLTKPYDLTLSLRIFRDPLYNSTDCPIPLLGRDH